MRQFIKAIVIYLGALLPLQQSGVRVYSTHYSRNNMGGPSRFLSNLKQSLSSKKIVIEGYLLARCRVALIFSYAPGKYFFSLCKRKKIKTVLRVDGFYSPSVFNNQNYEHRSTRILNMDRIKINQAMQNSLCLSDWVVYQSQYSKDMADKFLYNRSDCFSIIYNGVNTGHFKPASLHERQPPTILMLGYLRDVDLMICSLDAFRFYRERQNARLKIIGHATLEVERAIVAWLSAHPEMGEHITLTGQVGFDELPDAIASTQVSLHLKAGDNCPNAVLETLACGVPVVCQRWGGTSELVGDGGCILEHEPYVYDEDLSRKAALALASVIADQVKLSQRARHRSLNFEMTKTADQYLEVLT